MVLLPMPHLAVKRVMDADVILFAGGISPSLEGEEMPVFNRVERKTATSPMMKERVAIYKWNGLDGKNIPNSSKISDRG